jgi:hypothetical protein
MTRFAPQLLTKEDRAFVLAPTGLLLVRYKLSTFS